jgi:hypothetical protein
MDKRLLPQPQGSGPDRVAAEAMVRQLLEHVTDVLGEESTAGTREVIHPYAEMRLLVSFRKLLRGRTAIVDALEQGRAAVLFRARICEFAWLDDITVLSFGHARYLLEDGELVEGDVCWLTEFRDRLLWRVHAFDSEAGARRAYERQLRERKLAQARDVAA